MNLKRYFSQKDGKGILATSDSKGKVDLAVYSKPHVEGKDIVSFVMRQKLSYRNLKSNPKAAYMFLLNGSSTDGVRLYLKMKSEEPNQDKVLAARQRKKPLKKGEKLHLVRFKVSKARALVGDKSFPLT